MSQRKFVLDILEETGILDCKPIDTPMDPNVKLLLRLGDCHTPSFWLACTTPTNSLGQPFECPMLHMT